MQSGAKSIKVGETAFVLHEISDRNKQAVYVSQRRGNKILIVNKQADADELFEKRAKIYSDRPQIPMVKL